MRRMAEGWFLVEKLLLVAIGFAVCLVVMLAIQAHDAKRDRKIWVLQWENTHLKQKVDELRLELSKTSTAQTEKPLPDIRHPRSATKGENKRSDSPKANASNVPSAMTQKELGIMQANLSETGFFRGKWDGKAKLWM